jgi:NADH dehydrogenase [ubiquinone] 1 alpha subcomplex assembly factor 6
LTTIAMLARRGGGLARRGVTQVSASSPASERRGDGANVAGDALARTRASRAFSASSRARDASRPPSARDRMSVASAFEYCATRVRQLDYENYLCALFLPREHRPAALALRAFNAETASALGATKEPQLALMRLKWWRDAVDAAHDADENSLPDHPVAIALRAVLATQNAGGGARTKTWLKRIADARVRDAEMGLENQTPGSVAFLEAYAESTSSSVLYLQLDLGGTRDTSADHAASHLGKALGMVNLLRGTPAHAKQRRLYLPLDVCAKHGAVAEDVFRGKNTEAIKDATHEVASVAKAHLDSSRGMASTLRGVARKGSASSSTPVKPETVFLPAIAASTYLEKLERVDFDAFHPSLAQPQPPLVAQAKIAWAAFTGKY